LRCQVASSQVEESGEYPCCECRQGVDTNSNKCAGCVKWIRKRCYGVAGKLHDEDASISMYVMCSGWECECVGVRCFHARHGRLIRDS